MCLMLESLDSVLLFVWNAPIAQHSGIRLLEVVNNCLWANPALYLIV